MTVLTSPKASNQGRGSAPPRHPRVGTARRRRGVIAELLAIGASVVVGYYVLIGSARRLEVRAVADVLHVFGFYRISGALGTTLIIFRPNGQTISAALTPSCSSLMSVLALAALAASVLRRRRVHTFAAFVVAAMMLIGANMTRVGLSALMGLWLGRPALLLFHDWVGTLWTFAATLAGFLLLVSLTLPSAERAEQDRAGRHTARRPSGWGRTGLGYRVPALDRSQRNQRRTLTGLATRYLLPASARQALARRREARRIDYRIGHLSVDQRIGAVIDLAAPGLGVHTASLLAVATYETEAGVLDALAMAVVTRQWEPVATTAVGSLRLWARGWLMSHPIPKELLSGDPAFDPPYGVEPKEIRSGRPPSLPAGLTPAVPVLIPAVLAPALAAGTGPVLRTAVSLDPRVDGSGRIRRTVAVTGAGGPAGIAVVRSLVAAGHRVIALDADPLAAGLRLAAVAAVIPRADAHGYAEALMAVVAANGPEALICTVAEEYPALAAVVPSLDAVGCATWLPDPAAAEACCDKEVFALCLREAGVAHPPTASTARAARRIPGPWIVKPSRGRGSRDIVKVDDPNELAGVMASIPGAIAQSRLSGREFTADALVDRDGRLLTCVPRWRLETKAGISVRGQTFESEEVTQLVAEALAAVGLTGPANVQGFVDADGAATIVEINPRFSGGLPLTLAAGADVVGAYLEAICQPDVAQRTLSFTPGIQMLRYWAEVYEDVRTGASVADPTRPAAPEPVLVIAESEPDPEPEPTVVPAGPEPERKPEPVAVKPEPTAVAAEPEPEPERTPEPVAVKPEPDPEREADPVAAPAEAVAIVPADAAYQRRLLVLADGESRNNVAETCLVFGVSRSTFYRWRKQAARDGMASLPPKGPGEPLAPVA